MIKHFSSIAQTVVTFYWFNDNVFLVEAAAEIPLKKISVRLRSLSLFFKQVRLLSCEFRAIVSKLIALTIRVCGKSGSTLDLITSNTTCNKVDLAYSLCYEDNKVWKRRVLRRSALFSLHLIFISYQIIAECIYFPLSFLSLNRLLS